MAEDTRVSGRLLKHYDIKTPMRSYHAHNEHSITPRIIEELQKGLNIALISDAGTPAISDPGFLLVKHCHEEGIQVTCLPGASAAICAIASSGIPSDRFFFEGFLPHKKGRQTRLSYLKSIDSTIILYESPHRLVRTLNDICEFLGKDRLVACVKEISKLHETIYRGRAEDLLLQLSNQSIKGEFVVVIAREGFS